MPRLLLIVLLAAARISAYSVLTHEAIIDAAWDRSIKPLLLARYPGLTEEDLRKAHAHAYGGAIIQDMGYYPFGSRLFSDLVHYVRGGDFVVNLLTEAQNANELAFAIGALAHFAADDSGHSIAVNRVVPMLYPKLKKKFGNVVSYEQSPSAHVKTEFSFDVAQVAQQHYAPEAYHDFIGFEIAKPVLERAFLKTYGLELKDIFFSVDLAFGTFRSTVGGLVPEMTKVAWAAKEDEIVQAAPGTTRQKFIYNLSRASFEKEWGTEYQRPGILSRFLAWLFKIFPKVGPFRAFAFRPPTPEAQKLFMESFNQTLDHYRKEIATVKDGGPLNLPNENLDLGNTTAFGKYKLADEAYEKLLEKLAKKNYEGMDGKLRSTVLAYFRGAKGLDSKVAVQLTNLEKATLLPVVSH